jgi:6-pyruvoyltetrahydropterin/6-carboxytetrahydropterin synthase
MTSPSNEFDIVRVYRREFSAAHIISGHPKCGRMHGHNYVLLVKVHGRSSEWLDFENIKQTTDQLVDGKYDHQDLGSMTCERLAGHIQEQLSNAFRTTVRIELWETGKFGVEIL